MKKVYEVVVDYYSGPLSGYPVGISFSKKEIAEYYIDNFIKESERSCYKVVEREIFPIYESIDELLKLDPIKEVNRLNVVKELIEKEVELPFNINFKPMSKKNFKKDNVISYDVLQKIVNNLTVEEQYKSDEELYDDEKNDAELYFIISDGKNRGKYIEGTVSYQQFKTMKEINKEIYEEINAINSQIKSIKENVKDDNKENLGEEDERE